MQGKKCLAFLSVLRRKVLGYRSWRATVMIVIGTLALAKGAAGSDVGGEPDKPGVYNILHLFTWAKEPTGKLTFDAAGNLYGTTFGGGVFKLTPHPSGWRETVLHTFIGFGKNPMGPVIFDRTGNLYGTTSDGNHAFDYGLVFEITR